MIADFIADASIAVKWVITEPDSSAATQILSDAVAVGQSVGVLDLAVIEATNAVWVRYTRGLLSRPAAEQAVELLTTLPVVIVPAYPLLPTAFSLAAKHTIAVYDALFVAAASEVGGRGVTADDKLVRSLGNTFPEIKRLADW